MQCSLIWGLSSARTNLDSTSVVASVKHVLVFLIALARPRFRRLSYHIRGCALPSAASMQHPPPLQWYTTQPREAILETDVATVVIVWSDVVVI
jgi:outer membrane receptor for monomeric catechols